METEQEERPKGVRRSESRAEETVNTPDGEVFKENKAAKSVMNQSDSVCCTP